MLSLRALLVPAFMLISFGCGGGTLETAGTAGSGSAAASLSAGTGGSDAGSGASGGTGDVGGSQASGGSNGTSGGTTSTSSGCMPTADSIHETIIVPNCTASTCHGARAAATLNLAGTDWTSMLVGASAATCDGVALVVPGSPEQS